MLSKHVALTMRIINIIINNDDIGQEKPNKGSILKLNKRQTNVTKQEIWHTHQGISCLSGLEKIKCIAFLEVKLLAESPL